MMGMQTAPAQLFYDFCLDDHVPEDHLLRRIDRFLDLEKVRTELKLLIGVGPDADRRAKLLIHLEVEGALLGAYSHLCASSYFSSVEHQFDPLSSRPAALSLTSAAALP